MGHTKIVEYLLATWPGSSREVDNSGKTPLHYAASLKNNERIFNLLVQSGTDEFATDGVSFNYVLSKIVLISMLVNNLFTIDNRKDIQPVSTKRTQKVKTLTGEFGSLWS